MSRRADEYWKKLWVGTIPNSWTHKLFREYFERYGDVGHSYLSEPRGQSSNDLAGTITYMDYLGARTAIDEANGLEFWHRMDGTVKFLKVNWYDWDRAERERWNSQPEYCKASCLESWHKFGATGRQKKDGIKKDVSGPGIPASMMAGKGKTKGKGKTEDHGKGHGEDWWPEDMGQGQGKGKCSGKDNGKGKGQGADKGKDDYKGKGKVADNGKGKGEGAEEDKGKGKGPPHNDGNDSDDPKEDKAKDKDKKTS
jgi:hypothetical protein